MIKCNFYFNICNRFKTKGLILDKVVWHSHYSLKTLPRGIKRFNVKPTMQWDLIKARYPSHLIFFRIGAFYELLKGDAMIASQILNIRVNKMGHAGFPCHSIQKFIPKLICAGYNIAVVEETKIVKTNNSKSKFRDREVIALLSPSTYHLFMNDDNENENMTNNHNIVAITNQENEYVTCAASFFDSSKFKKLSKNPNENHMDFTLKNDKYFALCIMDTNIGKIETSHSNKNNLIHDLSRINPSEILLCSITAKQIPDIVHKMKELFHVTFTDQVLNNDDDKSLSLSYDEIVQHIDWNQNLRVCCNDNDAEYVDNNIRNIINSHCNVFSSKLQLSATLLLMLYLRQCKIKIGPEFIHSFSTYNNKDILFMDYSTRKALEITNCLYDNNYSKSLLFCLDKTNTKMGKRLLKQRLSSPITNIAEIERRLDFIEYFRDNANVRGLVIDKLKLIGDFQKNYQNILLKSMFCELGTLRLLANDIFLIQDIYEIIDCHSINESKLIKCDKIDCKLIKWAENVRFLTDNDVSDKVKLKLLSLKNENSIHSETALLLLKELKHETRIERIKLDYTHEMYGYCICIAPTYCANDAISFANTYNLQLISSNKSLYRFKTEKLSLMQIKYNEYGQLLKEHQRNIINEYINDLALISCHLYDIGIILSELDIASSFGNISLDRNHVRPQFISDNGEYLEISMGRHPILEYVNDEISFQANDCLMSNKSNNLLYLLSGANMSGKSTYLRQIALLIIMAQSGLYVPCNKMVLSLFDAIFVRFGSNDALFRDESTFMVEMNETANILKHSSNKSLIIMDEIAKSTTPIEGYCIAKAIIKYVHNNVKCRCLFSTHFYKCAKLEKNLTNLKCYYMVTNENENGEYIEFTHKLKQGVCNHSHAMYIAKIAGIPDSILRDSAKTFEKLSSKKNKHKKKLVTS